MINNYCECGCGKITKIGNRFIHGHTNKGKSNWNSGLTKEKHLSIKAISDKLLGRKNLNAVKGEKNHWYKDGRCQKYEEWRLLVYQKDNYTCQKCNKKVKGINCHTHHIKSKEEYPELIYDVDNGMTLCNGCHRSIHGKGKPSPLKGIGKPKYSQLCLCGCGQMTTPGKRCLANHFHNGMKGKNHLEKSKEKCRMSNLETWSDLKLRHYHSEIIKKTWKERRIL